MPPLLRRTVGFVLHDTITGPVTSDTFAGAAAAGATGVWDWASVAPPAECTVQVRVASVASMLPAASVARTDSVWSPSARFVSAFGEEHVAHAPASSLHA